MTYDQCARKNCLKTQVVLIRPGARWRGGMRSLLLASIVFMLLLIVWLKYEKYQIGYEISDYKKIQYELRETNRRLELKMAALKDPAKIVEFAKNDCGLSDPGQRVIYIYPEE